MIAILTIENTNLNRFLGRIGSARRWYYLNLLSSFHTIWESGLQFILERLIPLHKDSDLTESVDEPRSSMTAMTLTASTFDVEQVRREILLGGRGRRACSEQEPPPGTSHLWGTGRKSPWCKKRTSAPQMGASQSRTALVLRSRRSWPVAPMRYRR